MRTTEYIALKRITDPFVLSVLKDDYDIPSSGRQMLEDYDRLAVFITSKYEMHSKAAVKKVLSTMKLLNDLSKSHQIESTMTRKQINKAYDNEIHRQEEYERLHSQATKSHVKRMYLLRIRISKIRCRELDEMRTQHIESQLLTA